MIQIRKPAPKIRFKRNQKKSKRTIPKKKFTFVTKSKALAHCHPVAKNWMLLDVNMKCLGDFGYGSVFQKKWFVCHHRSGFQIAEVESEKEAKILTKKLHTKSKHQWKPTDYEIKSFLDFYQDCLSVLKKSDFIKFVEDEDLLPF